MSESTIDDRLDADYAPAWRPAVDDKLTGEVVALSERDGGYGTYPIITLKRDDGDELAVHAMHTVLSAQLAELRPKVGDRIAIKYLGKIANKAGTGSYHGYRAVSDAADGGVDWGRYGDGDEEAGGSDLPSTSDATTTTAPAVAADDEPLPF
jgi:hypothetical protein